MNEDHRLNRVLLESGLFARRYRTGSGCEGVVVDGSCVPFLIEEFVSLAATEIVIPSSAFEAAFVGRLPEKLQRRVKVVDVTDTEKQRIAIAQPLAEEFGVEIVPMGLYYAKHVPEDIAAALGGLYFALDHFLIGLRYQVQIDINLQHLRESVNKLLGVSRNPQARANLAILAGILRTYNSLPFDSFELRAQPADRLLGLFEEFLADETYRHISNNCYMLGFPERFQRARDMLSRLTRQLVRKPLFKPLLTLASRVVTAATGLPEVNSDLGTALMGRKYLPPVISMEGIIEKAGRAWRAAEPDFIHWSGKKYDVIDWEEQKRLDASEDE